MELIRLIKNTNVFGALRIYVEDIKRIIEEKRENIDDYDKDFQTPLFHAWRPEVVKYLLDKGANPNGSMIKREWPCGTVTYFGLPIIEAISSRKHEKLRLLLEFGANPNYLTAHDYDYEERDRSKILLPIMNARFNFEMVTVLFEFGVDANTIPEYNPLSDELINLRSCTKGYPGGANMIRLERTIRIVKLYLEKQVRFTIRDIIETYKSGHAGLACILASHFPDSRKFEYYQNHLHIVLNAGNYGCIKFFILFMNGALDRKFIRDKIAKRNRCDKFCEKVEMLIQDDAFPSLFDILYLKIKYENYTPTIVSDGRAQFEFRKHYIL